MLLPVSISWVSTFNRGEIICGTLWQKKRKHEICLTASSVQILEISIVTLCSHRYAYWSSSAKKKTIQSQVYRYFYPKVLIQTILNKPKGFGQRYYFVAPIYLIEWQIKTTFLSNEFVLLSPSFRKFTRISRHKVWLLLPQKVPLGLLDSETDCYGGGNSGSFLLYG